MKIVVPCKPCSDDWPSPTCVIEEWPSSLLSPIRDKKWVPDGVGEPFVESTHEDLLCKLWTTVFDEPFARRDPRWIDLGFQTEDPVLDLRGVGVVGLRLLSHFCQSRPAIACSCISPCEAAGRFPLAAASLNVTLMICSHLRLLDTPASGICSLPPCSEETNRILLELHHSLSIEPSSSCSRAGVLELLHEHSLCALYRRWEHLDSQTSSRPPKLLLFPRLLTDLSLHIQQALRLLPSPCTPQMLLIALDDDRSSCHFSCTHMDCISAVVSNVVSVTAAQLCAAYSLLLLPIMAMVSHSSGMC